MAATKLLKMPDDLNIVIKDGTLGAYYERDEYGRILPSGANSITEIETLDLVSEGPIRGLVSGEYSFSGIMGEIGYRTATFKPYEVAPESSLRYLRSVFWNEVPVVNSANKYNFQQIDVSFTKGLPNGSYVNQKSPELTVSRTINERLFGTELDPTGNATILDKDFTKVYRTLNPECKGCIINIKVNQLAETDTSNGDTVEAKVEYKIYYRPIFGLNNNHPSSFVLGKVDSIVGNINYGYIKSTRVDFIVPNNIPNDFIGWEIRIIRTTPDSISALVRNQTYVDSITEIYSDKFLYPNSAIVRSKFNAQYFAQVPNRAFDTWLLEVELPSNYEPITKTYLENENGWDGTFAEQKQWTDNPVWCYYDLIINPRYGLSRFIPNLEVDKWSLYEISKECDRLVPDGNGGLEPQFSCNLIINSREDAYKVFNDMTSIFRGMTYYAQGTIFAVSDFAKDPIVLFTNDNVENGDFNYSSSSKRARHTVALVRYNDKNNFFKPALEYVEDMDGIRRYGIKELDLAAFGCTSRGQAIRLGRWALLTETLETETVSFKAGLEAAYLRPGDVFQVADANRKFSRYAGRCNKISLIGNTGVFVLDDIISIPSNSAYYEMTLMAPNYSYNPLNINDLNSTDYSGIRNSMLQKVYFQGNKGTGLFETGKSIINIDNPIDINNFNFSTSPQNIIWLIKPSGDLVDDDDLTYSSTQYNSYRVINCIEEEPHKYQVIGLQYSANKYAEIASGLSLDRNINLIRTRPQTPENLVVYNKSNTEAAPVLEYSFTVPDYKGVNSFKIYVKKDDFVSTNVPDDSYLAEILPYNVNSSTYIPSQAGTYFFRVYAVNDEANLMSESYASYSFDVSAYYPVESILINSLKLEGLSDFNPAGVRLTGEYFTDSPTFTWQAGTINDNSLASSFNYRVTIRKPSSITSPNVPNSNIIYSKIGVKPEKSLLKYTFDFESNRNSIGGPYREYDVVVEAYDQNGDTSAGNTIYIEGDNAGQPSATEAWSVTQGYDILGIINNKPTGFYLSTTSGSDVYAGYKTKQWLDPFGKINCIFLSGSMPDDLVGGIVYLSTGLISGFEGITGSPFNYSLYTGYFDYETNSRAFSASIDTPILPQDAKQLSKSGYMCVSIYDSFDYETKDDFFATQTGKRWFMTGLYVTNPGSFTSEGSMRTLNATEKINIFNFTYPNQSSSLTVTSGAGNWYLKSTDQDGNEIIIATKS